MQRTIDGAFPVAGLIRQGYFPAIEAARFADSSCRSGHLGQPLPDCGRLTERVGPKWTTATGHESKLSHQNSAAKAMTSSEASSRPLSVRAIRQAPCSSKAVLTSSHWSPPSCNPPTTSRHKAAAHSEKRGKGGRRRGSCGCENSRRGGGLMADAPTRCSRGRMRLFSPAALGQARHQAAGAGYGVPGRQEARP